MALFTLKITDNIETVDFLNTGDIEVLDGGFDIGMPRVDRAYSIKRSGPFFEPASIQYRTRPATISFRVFGATRSTIISKLNKIERILRAADARTRLSAGRRVELQYTWSGASVITYFEILGGELILPPDVLSVEKMHATGSGVPYVPEIELRLELSPFGYGRSIYLTPNTEIPLYNPNVGSKTTGGILVENDFAGNYNYVEIEDTDVPGANPWITKIVVNGKDATSQYDIWSQMYFGLRVSPFPTALRFEGENRAGQVGGSQQTQANASNGSYWEFTHTTTTAPYFGDTFAYMYWTVDPDNTKGLFYAFMSSGPSNYSTSAHYAIGLYDYVQNGYRIVSDWVTPRTGYAHLPIGVIQIPPDIQLTDFGSAYTSYMGLFYGQDSGKSSIVTQVDFISLMPIDDGLRVWLQRGVSATSHLEGDMVDDSWLGSVYLDRDDSAGLTTPFFGILDPLKLEPNKDQRIYITSVGPSGYINEGARSYRVQVYGVPTYKTLAL